MRKQEVRRDIVESCISSPELVTDSILDRKNHWRRHEEGYLRVTIAEEDEALVVGDCDRPAQAAGGDTMKISYDPEADALYIELRDARPADSVDIEEGVTADLDGEGHIIGLEVLDASKRMTLEDLANVSYENLLLVSVPHQ
jgi:uncharacterized protein YuzE